MYNRYIPQPDGSFKRRMMEDRSPSPSIGRSSPGPREQEKRQEEQPSSPPKASPPSQDRARCRDCPKQRTVHPAPEKSAGAFLRDLLPKDLDTGDLLVIVLLLLMSADGTEDQGNALLTLALYLFM